MKKIAIIGANEFQNRLILKAKELGIETHVFAWEDGAVGKENSDYFYPISIVEKDIILEKCKEIGIDGICSIASDLAMLTVNYVADKLGLVGNSLKCTKITTNKYEMRKQLSNYGLPCPYFKLIRDISDVEYDKLKYPLIIKPTDRSGSRGIYKIEKMGELEEAIKNAQKESFSKEVILEEFIDGQEYSVEGISQNGEHHILQITKKYTTGAPHFIEIAHEQPALLNKETEEQIKTVVIKSLNALKVCNGASHTELKIDNGKIKIIEIGARMGGDFIGSDLVEISTGIDFLELVLKVALGIKISVPKVENKNIAFVKFLFDSADINKIKSLTESEKECITDLYIKDKLDIVTDSSNRNGYCIFKIENLDILNEIKEVIM